MKATADHKPELGKSARTLGIRVNRDITPDREGYVYPETGGMSIAPNDPKLLPLHRRPPSFGGNGRDPVFKMHISALSESLTVRQDKPDHGMVEPALKVHITEYEEELYSTQPKWEICHE